MKELCIQVCPRARLMIEVTEEMERSEYYLWDIHLRNCRGAV